MQYLFLIYDNYFYCYYVSQSVITILLLVGRINSEKRLTDGQSGGKKPP